MYTCSRVHVYTYISIQVDIPPQKHVIPSIHSYVHMSPCTQVSTYISPHGFTCARVHVHTCLRAHACVHLYTHAYPCIVTHASTWPRGHVYTCTRAYMLSMNPKMPNFTRDRSTEFSHFWQNPRNSVVPGLQSDCPVHGSACTRDSVGVGNEKYGYICHSRA